MYLLPSKDILYFESAVILSYFVNKVVKLSPDCGIERLLFTSDRQSCSSNWENFEKNFLKEQKFELRLGEDITFRYMYRKCKRVLPALFGLMFLWTRKVMEGRVAEWSLMIVALGRSQMRKWGEGAWSNSFCEHCRRVVECDKA
jgi:hypothetical protein